MKVVNTVLEKTSSGGFCSNDGIVHMTLPSLPFGGVGKVLTLQLYSPTPTYIFQFSANLQNVQTQNEISIFILVK